MNKIKRFYNKLSFLIFLFILFSIVIDIRLALAAIICIIGPIIYASSTKRHGRLWCGYVCPRGNLYNRVGKDLRNRRQLSKKLKSNITRTIIVLCLFSMFGLAIYKNYNDLRAFSTSLYGIILLTTWIGLIMAYVFYPRSWCAICPVGSIIDVIEYKKRGNSKSNRHK
ncbi:4Fe-4S binding protein [Mycoplasmatota bacterium WC44]